ncbi:hypothetical protein BC831DRAFT_218053 [Entophlyctis helioformis]|nr:hypothetical protein BC831DRAFT_218053 [Entophlyctis helioformis]
MTRNGLLLATMQMIAHASCHAASGNAAAKATVAMTTASPRRPMRCFAASKPRTSCKDRDTSGVGQHAQEAHTWSASSITSIPKHSVSASIKSSIARIKSSRHSSTFAALSSSLTRLAGRKTSADSPSPNAHLAPTEAATDTHHCRRCEEGEAQHGDWLSLLSRTPCMCDQRQHLRHGQGIRDICRLQKQDS